VVKGGQGGHDGQALFTNFPKSLENGFLGKFLGRFFFFS
jgi:hypothetical protein